MTQHCEPTHDSLESQHMDHHADQHPDQHEDRRADQSITPTPKSSKVEQQHKRAKSPYLQLFELPGAKAFCASAAIARLPMSMIGLGIVLALNRMYDNWTIAGTMSAAYILAAAVVTPVYARMFDKYGQRKVGSIVLIVQLLAMFGFCFSALARIPIPFLFVLAIVMGATQFSFGALVRTRWTYLLDRTGNENLLDTAYALEAAIDEIVFIFGPILAATLAVSVHPVSQLFVPTIAVAIGGTIFLSLKDSQPPVLREVSVESDLSLRTPSRPRSALMYAGILPLMIAFVLFNMSFTTFDVSITAHMESLNLDHLLGVQLALIAVGSCIGAFVFGSREHRTGHWRRIVILFALLAVGFVAMHATMDHLIALGIVEVLAGLTVSPVFATGNLIVKETVPASALTEGLSWLSTGGSIGASFGSMLGGIVLDHADAHAGLMTTWIYVVAAIPFAMLGWWIASRKTKEVTPDA